MTDPMHREYHRRGEEIVLPRRVAVGDILRYSRDREASEATLGSYLNYWYLQTPPFQAPRLMLESGINGAAAVATPSGPRVPAMGLRSSPWKAGNDVTPWHDEFDLDHGHVRYFGDHKVDMVGPVGSTKGNKQLLNLWQLHGSGHRDERMKAAPILMYRATPVYVDGRKVDKGHLEFCGVGIIERLEYIVQRDPRTGRTFPNLVLDLNMIRLDQNDEMDFRWIDDRRNPALTTEETLAHAPDAWVKWVNEGRVALPQIRRRVVSSRVLSRADQMPEPGTPQVEILNQIYRAFDDNKHAFEWLAARVTEHVLTETGSSYTAGWLTRAGGDGGMDFVGRLSIGSTKAQTPLVVLGQAKCIVPGNSISPDQVARVVARLRRGWVGVFVTTGVFSQQAQIEIVDDEYPIVLIGARTLTDAVYRLANQSYNGDVSALLQTALDKYGDDVTHRRPHEVLSLA